MYELNNKQESLNPPLERILADVPRYPLSRIDKEIEAELPEHKYIDKFTKECGGKFSIAGTYEGMTVNLVINMGGFNNYDILRQKIIENSILIDGIKNTKNFWKRNNGIEYFGNSPTLKYTLETKKTGKETEKITLKVDSKSHTSEIPRIIRAIKQYIREYEKTQIPKVIEQPIEEKKEPVIDYTKD